MLKTEPFTEVVSLNQPLELFSRGRSNPYTDNCKKGLHWDFSDGEGDHAHCSSRSPKQLFLRVESYRVFFLVQIINHWTEISEIQDKQQWLHKKAGVCHSCTELRIAVVLQKITSGSTSSRKKLYV